MRRGFTLIELLVACGVFLFGFTAALGLMLIGTRARSQADGMLRLSLAASSIVEEIRLEAGRESTAPLPPSAYVGDGFATVSSGADSAANPSLYRYDPQPGIWYRVLECVDEKGVSNDAQATALRLDLLVVWNPVADTTLDINALADRQGLSRTNSPVKLNGLTADEKISKIADFMAKRGIAVRETAWIIRKPSWER
jgi:prepilin-type N-terminal cleavage/methylation domain-containing protein